MRCLSPHPPCHHPLPASEEGKDPPEAPCRLMALQKQGSSPEDRAGHGASLPGTVGLTVPPWDQRPGLTKAQGDPASSTQGQATPPPFLPGYLSTKPTLFLAGASSHGMP